MGCGWVKNGRFSGLLGLVACFILTAVYIIWAKVIPVLNLRGPGDLAGLGRTYFWTVTKMVYAAYDWLEAVHNDDLFKDNTEKFMTLFSLSFPDLQE